MWQQSTQASRPKAGLSSSLLIEVRTSITKLLVGSFALTATAGSSELAAGCSLVVCPFWSFLASVECAIWRFQCNTCCCSAIPHAESPQYMIMIWLARTRPTWAAKHLLTMIGRAARTDMCLSVLAFAVLLHMHRCMLCLPRPSRLMQCLRLFSVCLS
jgi:hypothetical protein